MNQELIKLGPDEEIVVCGRPGFGTVSLAPLSVKVLLARAQAVLSRFAKLGLPVTEGKWSDHEADLQLRELGDSEERAGKAVPANILRVLWTAAERRNAGAFALAVHAAHLSLQSPAPGHSEAELQQAAAEAIAQAEARLVKSGGAK